MEKPPLVLELFAGSRSIGKEAEKLGMRVFSTDINDFEGIDLVADILTLKASDFPKPDIIWASPPCTAFSVAAIGHHWTGGNGAYIPATEGAHIGLSLVVKTLALIKELQPKHWFIENPRGMLRKMPIMQGLPRCTVWYCQYGDQRAKPTDIWSNNLNSLFNPGGFVPRSCYNNNAKCHHDKCPRGTNNGLGTQGMAGNYERSTIPAQLCAEILTSTVG